MRKETVVCDFCKEDIVGDRYIDASVYGRDIHVSCLKTMNAFTLIKFLGLDDIALIEKGRSVNRKLIHTDYAQL